MKAIKEALNRFEQRVATLWPGWKTKILLGLGAIAPVASLAGVAIDPEGVTAWMEQWWAHLMAVETAIVALAAWTRRLTDVYANLKGTSKKTSKKNASKKRGGSGAVHSLALIVITVGLLGGCTTTSNVDKAAQLLAERPPKTCQVPVDGQMVMFTGSDCDRLMAEYSRSQALKACAEFAESNEPMCVLAVALQGAGGNGGDTATASDEVQLMMTAMQQDGANRRAWIGTIPVVGNLLAVAYQTSQSEKTLRTAFENSGTRVGTVNVTKSDDGGDAMSGEGAATGGAGGNGDQFVTIGNHNQSIPGDGSIITEGRNPVLIGTGQPDSSLDPSTVNNSNQTAPDNPTNNAPVVETSDDDGGQRLF